MLCRYLLATLFLGLGTPLYTMHHAILYAKRRALDALSPHARTEALVLLNKAPSVIADLILNYSPEFRQTYPSIENPLQTRLKFRTGKDAAISSPDGSQCCTLHKDTKAGTPAFFLVHSTKNLWRCKKITQPFPIIRLEWTPQGNFIIVVTQDAPNKKTFIIIYDARTLQQVKVAHLAGDPVLHVTSSSNEQFITFFTSTHIVVYNIHTDRYIKIPHNDLLSKENHTIGQITIAPDNNQLAYTYKGTNVLKVFNLKEQRITHTITCKPTGLSMPEWLCSPNAIEYFVWAPNSKQLAVSTTKEIMVVELDKKAVVQSWPKASDIIATEEPIPHSTVLWTRNGRYIIWAHGYDRHRTIIVHDAVEKTTRHIPSNHEDPITDLIVPLNSINPEHCLFISISMSKYFNRGCIKIWDAKSATCVQILVTKALKRVQWLSDNDPLVTVQDTGSDRGPAESDKEDNVVEVWQARMSKEELMARCAELVRSKDTLRQDTKKLMCKAQLAITKVEALMRTTIPVTP